ncbi:hypothetical protein ACCO45_002609 [Purpureocillium lilacinum]|uniref:Uncharacterized protein n=1 Tax=Purpureocillium lilacinum TaxID=33203 RepID=A0ACC4EAC7_PURLI
MFPSRRQHIPTPGAGSRHRLGRSIVRRVDWQQARTAAVSQLRTEAHTAPLHVVSRPRPPPPPRPESNGVQPRQHRPPPSQETGPRHPRTQVDLYKRGRRRAARHGETCGRAAANLQRRQRPDTAAAAATPPGQLFASPVSYP